MTRKSLIARENKRMKTVAKYATKRAELKKTFLDMSKTDEERFEAYRKLQKLPRNASPSRIKLREAAMRGDIPGLVKSSW